MNEEQSRAETESKEFRVRYPLWMYAGFVGVLFFCGVFVFAEIVILSNYYRITGSAPSDAGIISDVPLMLGLMLAVYGLGIIGLGYRMIQDMLEQKRGRARVDERNLTLTDWRARERAIALSDIQELRVVSWGLLYKPAFLAIKTKDRWINLSSGLVKSEELTEELVSRCHLTIERESWVATSYTRGGVGEKRA